MTVIDPIFRIFYSVSVRAWGARARRFSASRPAQVARADSSGGRKLSTWDQNDTPPRGLPPTVVRVTTRCPWTRRRPVEAAGHVFSLSCTSMCRSVPNLFWLCTSVPRLLIAFLVLIFCYISFNFVRLGPPISIDWMSKFHFGHSTFNFRIGCI